MSQYNSTIDNDIRERIGCSIDRLTRNNFAFVSHLLHNSTTEKLLGNETAKLSFALLSALRKRAIIHRPTRALRHKRRTCAFQLSSQQQKFDIVKAPSRTSINARSRSTMEYKTAFDYVRDLSMTIV